jgi:MFS family permease
VHVLNRHFPQAHTLLLTGLSGLLGGHFGKPLSWHQPRVLAYMSVKAGWCVCGGILLLLAVFGEQVFPLGGSAAAGIGVLYAARGVGTAVGPFVARRVGGESRRSMQRVIGLSFFVGGVFYVAFALSTNFLLALLVLAAAHAGGSTLWVYSTVLLQQSVEDEFRGRVFAAELAALTLALAASNYVTGELLDRFHFGARAVTVGTGLLFLLPGLLWFATARWWDKGRPDLGEDAPGSDAATTTAAAED